VTLKALIDATGDYHFVVAENRRMFNELQELKGAAASIFCTRFYTCVQSLNM
jgi:hypothetical protein